MIRLSCWVGALGCTIGEDAGSAGKECSVLSVLQPPVRCIETDVGEIERLNHLAFADVSARLAHRFQSVCKECGTSLEEARRFLQACRERLACRDEGGRDPVAGSPAPDRGNRSACLTDS